MPPRLLLYVLYPSLFRGMFRLAKLARDSGRWEPTIFFDRLPPYERDVQACADERIRCVGNDGRPLHASAPDRARLGAAALAASRQLLARAPNALAPATLAMRIAAELVDIRASLALARRIVRDERIDLVAMPGDSIGYGTPMLIRAAHERGKAAAIVPFTVSAASEVIADRKNDASARVRGAERRAVAALFPRWVERDGDGARLLRLPPERIVALELAHLAPEKPWVLHSGAADSLAMESEYMRDHYRREGLPVERYTMTGALADDTAAAALADLEANRIRLRAELGLPGSDRLIVFSLSDYSAFFARGVASEFRSQADLVDFWIGALAGCPGFSVVVSLHPWLKIEEMRHIERPNVRISTRPVEELIALGDLFVANISATVRTAIACGRPVLDHDVFRFRYRNFDGLPGVVTVERRQAFVEALQRWTRDPAALADAEAAQRQVAARFGRLDGQAGARILAWMDEVRTRRRA